MSRQGVSDELKLLERCRNGELKAIDELVALYEKRVFNFAYRICGDYDQANDVAQEAFIRIINSAKTFRGESSFSTWIYRIVKNVYLDEIKKSKSHRLTSLDDYVELEESSVSREIKDDKPSPDEIVQKNEQSKTIQRAISALPENQRMIISLYHLQNQSYEEISAVLDLPVGTVKSRLSRARLALAEILKDDLELFN